LIDQFPLFDIDAAKGPEVTFAPCSDVPENVTIRLVTVAPLRCDVTLIRGGVVSRAFVVVGAAFVVVGAAVVAGAAVVVGAGASLGSTETGSSAASSCASACSSASGSASVVVVVSGDVDVVAGSASVEASVAVAVAVVVVAGASVTVVAIRDSGSVTRNASTAEATLAEASGADTAGIVVVVSSAGDEVAGENAANPITAIRPMMRSPAYARGMRGFTLLRGLEILPALQRVAWGRSRRYVVRHQVGGYPSAR
jgi:hypothetical protein